MGVQEVGEPARGQAGGALEPAVHGVADPPAGGLEHLVVHEPLARGGRTQVIGAGDDAHEVGPGGGQVLGGAGDEHALDVGGVVRGGGGVGVGDDDGDAAQPGGGHVQVDDVEGGHAQLLGAPGDRLVAAHLPRTAAAAVPGDAGAVADLDLDRQQRAELVDQGAHGLRLEPVLPGQGDELDDGPRLGEPVGRIGDDAHRVGAVGAAGPGHGRARSAARAGRGRPTGSLPGSVCCRPRRAGPTHRSGRAHPRDPPGPPERTGSPGRSARSR